MDSVDFVMMMSLWTAIEWVCVDCSRIMEMSWNRTKIAKLNWTAVEFGNWHRIRLITLLLHQFWCNLVNHLKIHLQLKMIAKNTGSLVIGHGIREMGMDCSLIQELAQKELVMRLFCNPHNFYAMLPINLQSCLELQS